MSLICSSISGSNDFNLSSIIRVPECNVLWALWAVHEAESGSIELRKSSSVLGLPYITVIFAISQR